MENNNITLDTMIGVGKKKKIAGKECYEISTMYNPNYIYDENSKDLKIYIEKDSGLPVKVVETIEENGEKIQNTIAYEYAFDCVTDEDIAEPEDRSYNLIT